MEKLFVIKIGGNVIDDEKALADFLTNFASIKDKKILVHGGGKIATQIGNQMGIAANYIDGRRITDAATIDLVTMVYGGLINKKIVAQLQALQCNAIGLCGADANIIAATKRSITTQNIDFGFVGDIDVKKINTKNFETLLTAGFMPVIAPLTHDGNGQILNTNADTIASAIAIALSTIFETRLIYCFEKTGVLQNIENPNSIIKILTQELYQDLKNQHILTHGILPKIDTAFSAIQNGVKEVLIGHSNDLIKNISENFTGTLIK
jgi:acetylglutamate kinase